MITRCLCILRLCVLCIPGPPFLLGVVVLYAWMFAIYCTPLFQVLRAPMRINHLRVQSSNWSNWNTSCKHSTSQGNHLPCCFERLKTNLAPLKRAVLWMVYLTYKIVYLKGIRVGRGSKSCSDRWLTQPHSIPIIAIIVGVETCRLILSCWSKLCGNWLGLCLCNV